MNMEINEKQQTEQKVVPVEQIGPTKKEVIQYSCIGCKYLYDRGVTMNNRTMHQYFCRHLDKIEFTTGKAIGTSDLTPEWCPELNNTQK